MLSMCGCFLYFAIHVMFDEVMSFVALINIQCKDTNMMRLVRFLLVLLLRAPFCQAAMN